MTRRTRLATAAVLVIVIGVTVRPFLSSRPPGHQHHPARRSAVAAVADPRATATATSAARAALACAPVAPLTSAALTRSPRRRWCGQYTATRTQTVCRTPTACTVQMIGTLTTPAARSVAALTVSLDRFAGRWQVTGMRS